MNNSDIVPGLLNLNDVPCGDIDGFNLDVVIRFIVINIAGYNIGENFL